MKYVLLTTAAAVLALASPAFAGNDNGPKGGDSSAVAGAAAGAVAGAAAGAISGSSSTAVAGPSISGASVGDIDVRGGAGGSVFGSGNSNTDVRNTNTNLNTDYNANVQGQHQGQGQMQGQTASSNQGQSQAITNAGNSSNTNTNSARTDNANNASQTTNVNVEGDHIPRQVATAQAPIVVNVASCAIGGSVAGQGPGFGFALGGARIDQACDLRAMAQVLFQIGEKEAAVLLLSQDKRVNAAVTTARTRK